MKMLDARRFLAPVILSLVVLGGCGKAPTADPNRLESYARSWFITPAEGKAEQQLSLPAETLLTLKTHDLGDLRLFDGAGRPLPAALFKEAEERSRLQLMKSYPVLGTEVPREAGVALIIAPDQVARAVGVARAPGRERQVALLVDSREVGRRVLGVQISANLPLQRPVTFRAAASSDLKTWELLGEKTLFRTDADGSQLEQGRLPLGGVTLKDRYLQITWDAVDGVSVMGAQLITGINQARPSVTLSTSGARLEGTHELRFSLPDGGHFPAAVELELTGNEGVLPVEFFSRRDPEAPWQRIEGTTLRSGMRLGNRLTFDAATGREFRIVADKRTGGFAALPRVILHYAEVVMLTRFNGKPPYRLAAGLAGAPRNLLTPADIVPQGNPVDLPRATVTSGPLPRVEIGPVAPAGPLSGRKAAMWLVLLGGIVVLGLAVVRLLRRQTAAED